MTALIGVEGPLGLPYDLAATAESQLPRDESVIRNELSSRYAQSAVALPE
jgi:hypothetical protein